MREQVCLTGMVLKASPVGEYDRRLVILTCERGKITAFARGARRPGNSLMACSGPFVFGKFMLYEGKESYTLASAEVTNYFREIAVDMEAACYGSYFLEFADYYGRENVEAVEILKLLYQSLRALLKESIPNRLVKPVFELKLMQLNGEYSEQPRGNISDSARYTWEYVLYSTIEKLYTFNVKAEVLREFERCVEDNKRRFVDKQFHSLDILGVLVDNIS
ncbi:MAG: DNA repair protein RecO [Lachnospiraceae bacterium]|nr:DNA repair protein RecO [Lachnospiraceae bacterium]